jgi:hypothetical protein
MNQNFLAYTLLALLVYYLVFKEDILSEFTGGKGIPSGPPGSGGAGVAGVQPVAALAGAPPRMGPGNTRLATSIESSLGAAAGAAVCTAYGAAAAAPLCAKLGSVIAPKAIHAGVVATIKGTELGAYSTNLGARGVVKATALGTFAADKVAGAADTLWNDTGRLPAPLGVAAKVALAPVKVVADVGAKGAQIVGTGAKDLASGTKAATHAVVSGVKKVLGFL